MSANDGSAESRRQFLSFLASTPVLAGSGLVPYFASALASAQDLPADLIRAAEEALNVFAFEPVAKDRMLPVHYGYTASGTDDEETLRANREGFQKYRLRVRRLIDVRNVDTST
ncbi:MAG: alpha-hydroxy-acid oxidizing protein, partial [Gammaproteobacteria bacterium]|nr:alpha-hydroxy-acid oxidizing protein [Gammaproteobacteria bacterium]